MQHDGRPTDDAHLVRAILDTAHEAYISLDADGLVLQFNAEAERAFGYPKAEVVGRELAALIIPARHRDAHRQDLLRCITGGDGQVIDRPVEMSALHRDGHEFPIEMTISAIRTPSDGGELLTFHAFLHDISARKRSEWVLAALQAITESMARGESPTQAVTALLRALGESMGWDVGAYWELAHDGALERTAAWTVDDERLRAFSANCADMRLTREDSFPGRGLAVGQPVWLQDWTTDDSFARVRMAREAGLLAAVAVPVKRGEDPIGVIELLARDDRVRDSSVSDALSAVCAQVGELLGFLEERQALLTSLARLALTDQLTGLPNRRAWEEGLQRELARADRDGHPVCVAVIDLDEFKAFNDRHGHQAGDELLAAAARAWQAQLRASDLLARYGGEEFAAVIPAWPLETVIAVVDRLRAATPRGLTASAGVASWDRTESAAELFGRADAALYEAKQSGRNRTIAAPDLTAD